MEVPTIEARSKLRIGGKLVQVRSFVSWDNRISIDCELCQEWHEATEQDASDRRLCRFRHSEDEQWQFGTVMGVADGESRVERFAVLADAPERWVFCNFCEVRGPA